MTGDDPQFERFRDVLGRLAAPPDEQARYLTDLGVAVLGVSRDSVKSHDNFCAKQGFKFPLVSDADEALCKAFDVIHEKNMYGRKVLGVVRSTFLLSPDSRIAREWRGVKVPGHAQAVLDALKAEASQ